MLLVCQCTLHKLLFVKYVLPFIQKLKSQNHFTMDQKILVRLFFPFENVNILPATLDGMVDSVALNVFEYLKGL